MPQHPLVNAMHQDIEKKPQSRASRHGWDRNEGLDTKPCSRDLSPGSTSTSRSRSPHPRAGGTLASLCADTDAEKFERLQGILPADARDKLLQLVNEGTISRGVFDFDALFALASLTNELREKVLRYMDSERIFLMNSRSKSGFLKAACDRAKHGSLDVKGIGLQDPWRNALLAVSTPKRKQIDLVPEDQWIKEHEKEPAQISVDVSIDNEVGVSSITLAMHVTQPIVTVKNRLAEIGVKIPVHKMQLKEGTVGFLKNDKSLAFYNIQSGSLLHLVYKKRAGIALRRDHSVQGGHA